MYLQQAREHEKPRGVADVNPADIFLQVEVGDEFLYQHEHLIMGLTFALAKSVRADRKLEGRRSDRRTQRRWPKPTKPWSIQDCTTKPHSRIQLSRRWRQKCRTC